MAPRPAVRPAPAAASSSAHRSGRPALRLLHSTAGAAGAAGTAGAADAAGAAGAAGGGGAGRAATQGRRLSLLPTR